MRRVASMLFVTALLLPMLCRGAEPPDRPATAASAPVASTRISPETPTMHLGDVVRIIATGRLNERLRQAPAEPVTLLLDDVEIPGLAVERFDSAGPDALELSFRLQRDPDSEPSRNAWNTVLGGHHSARMPLTVAVRVGNDPAWRVQPAFVDFHVAPAWRIWLVTLGAVLAFALAFRALVRHPSFLRDSPGGAYSLGKTQMAFWGLVVALSFFGTWLVTQQMERIPAGVLILMGISAATGLGAQMIQTGKADARARLKATPAPTPVSQGFWYDLSNGGQGPSFHRVQMVLWTAILGLVFVRSVIQLMTMPEFGETLLVLMGISSGTYLGFKFPEPDEPPAPGTASPPAPPAPPAS
jgi:hypothetical protein